MDYLTIVVTACGGFGLFIYGMYVLADGMQRMASGKMKRLLDVLTRNKYLGVAVGAGVTAIIQSSSATTVMVVGFVNAGLMQLNQAVGVIMGANIGTTATAWLVSSVEWAAFLKPDNIAGFAMAIGAFMVLFTKSDKVKQTGEIVAGFGMLFIGMHMMSDGLKPLAESETFRSLFLSMGHNPVLGLLAGLLVTAIIQSSSASVGILQGLALNGLVPWNAAVYIIMGQNIGTCVTALLSSLGATRNAKAAAYVHLLFNITGSLFFMMLGIIYFKFINSPIDGSTTITSTEISLVHTVFNVTTTVLLMPMARFLVVAAEKIARVGNESEASSLAALLDARVLTNPPAAAIERAIVATTRLGRLALENLRDAGESLLSGDASKSEQCIKKEQQIDELTDNISKFIVKILNLSVTERESANMSALFHTLTDMERVGDHAENLAETGRGVSQGLVLFSEPAHEELREMIDKTIHCFEFCLLALERNDVDAANAAIAAEDDIDKLDIKFRGTHIRRLAAGICSAAGEVAFVNTLIDLERVADHANNIAKNVLGRPEHSKDAV